MNAILHGWPQRLKTISTTNVAIRPIRRVTLSTFGDHLRVKFVYADYCDIPIVRVPLALVLVNASAAPASTDYEPP